MDLQEAKRSLVDQQKLFAQTALEPNTLQRNITLAGYRTEITKLEKLIAKPVKPSTSASKASKLQA